MVDDIPVGRGFAPKRACMSRGGFAGTLASGLAATGETRTLVRRAAFTAESLVDASASMEPNDLTVSARWPPVVDGAAGEEDNKGLGVSTVPKAMLPVGQ